MATFKKKQLDELVGGDMFSSGGDRNQVNNSEIETGPYDKSYDDDSYYEKNVSTTTDRVFARYRQNMNSVSRETCFLLRFISNLVCCQCDQILK